MRVSVLHPFRYSPDGINSENALRGQTIDLDADLAAGFAQEGFVELLDEPSEQNGGYEIRHMGRSKYAVFHAGVRLTPEPIPKEEAKLFLEAHRSKQ